MKQDAKLSDAEKTRYGRAYKEASRLQREAEDGCRAELGIRMRQKNSLGLGLKPGQKLAF
jgi:hypothetical protein